MMASSCAMSAAIKSRVSRSATLNSVSRRKRASGVRRSCEMPASIKARSCSILAKRSAIRLKPMFTSRISEVAASSSKVDVLKCPSRTWLAAKDNRFRGRLMRPAIKAAPPKDSAKVRPSQVSHAEPPSGRSRAGSICNQ